jgi:arylsulfatase A-like enzyme
MAPTLLSLAGLPVPSHMQGTDLSRVALGQTSDGPEAVLLQIFVPFNPDQVSMPWRGIVTSRYTYARYEHEPWVLFDRERDPAELNNLANQPEQAALQKQLDEQLAALMGKHGDRWKFNFNELVEEGGRLYRTKTFYTIGDFLDWTKISPDAGK